MSRNYLNYHSNSKTYKALEWTVVDLSITTIQHCCTEDMQVTQPRETCSAL